MRSILDSAFSYLMIEKLDLTVAVLMINKAASRPKKKKKSSGKIDL